MTDAETGLVERDIATTGTISTTGNGRTARLGTSTSDVYLFNSKNNSYLQSKDEGYLAFDNNPILLSRQLGTTNLDTLKDPIHYGLWGNPTNAIATADRNYPTLKAGSLLVMLSANGVQQIYSIFDTKSIYKRNQKLDGGWYNWVDVTAVEWSEVSNKPATATRWPTTGEIGAISKTGDTATGNYYFNNSHFQISRDNVTSGQWWGGLNLRADVDGLETGLGVRHEGPRGIQLGMYGVINDGHKAKWSLNLCQPGNNAFGDNDRVMEVIYNGGIWTKVYGWLHDHFAKQDDINNVWNELNNTYRKNRYRHQHYPHHYNGSDVFDIPVADNSVMRVIVMNVTSNGYTRVLLPEAYNGLCIVQATDVGGGRKVVGANIQNGTVVEIHNGGEVVGLNILTIGWYGW